MHTWGKGSHQKILDCGITEDFGEATYYTLFVAFQYSLRCKAGLLFPLLTNSDDLLISPRHKPS